MMGAAYSVDLRRKVIQACERGTASQAEVARFFGVSLSFVEKLLRLHRRTGALEPDRKRAGRPA
jgi:transposase